MLKGHQAEVVTPGNNVKRHLAGSLVWANGQAVGQFAHRRIMFAKARRFIQPHVEVFGDRSVYFVAIIDMVASI